MKYFSTNNRNLKVSFQEAVFNSLPLDNGLYFPEQIPSLSKQFLKSIPSLSKEEIGYEIASNFIGDEIPFRDLKGIVNETVNFDIPLVSLSPNISILELFHGPTWAFKDVGARFLSKCMAYFIEQRNQEVHILVATSGDTGGAVAAGFDGIDGINVTILYPKGKISDIQLKQLTTWGNNIRALEVDGTFDDCQSLVKMGFLDQDLNDKINLSSANSINIARLIPQSFYYFFAFQQLNTKGDVVFSVPSGNYGNLTAGLLAWKMGLPIRRFIAASNDNRIVPDYLVTGKYEPKSSIETYANAMDVGAPSNFVRMMEIFENNHEDMIKMIEGFSLSDEGILSVIRTNHKQRSYVLDPHGAVGFEALNQLLKPSEHGIFIETAHPVKFLEVVEKSLDQKTDYDTKIECLLKKTSVFTPISTHYEDLKETLLSN